MVEQVIIDKIELVYYIDGGNTTQKTVEPHYLISGTFVGSDASENGPQPTESEFIWLANAIEQTRYRSIEMLAVMQDFDAFSVTEFWCTEFPNPTSADIDRKND